MGGLIFTSPWLLLFLLVLPVIWYLLRLTPPAPKRVSFPAIRLLQELVSTRQTPAQTPWWLLLLRLLITALLIVALAGPILNPQQQTTLHGPIVLVIDNDWAAARNWPVRQEKLQQLLTEAERNQRGIYWLATAPAADGTAPSLNGPLSPASARALVQTLQPQPWPADYTTATTLINEMSDKNATAIWLASGLGGQEAEALYEVVSGFAQKEIISDHATTPLYMLDLSRADPDQPNLVLYRAEAVGPDKLAVAALDANGETLSQLPLDFSKESTRTEHALALPVDIRNRIARFTVIGAPTAGTTILMDESWRRRPVGVIGDPAETASQSLLSPLYYIERALKPYADLHTNDLTSLLQKPQSVLILTDQTLLTQSELTSLETWIKQGGMLIRFAGPKLAAAVNPLEQNLLPVTLRTGDRALGGALSWSTPQKLRAPLAPSPFVGLTLPDDVVIKRQILAEPSLDLAARTWLALQDGTPLVTAKTMGQGTSVLVHVTSAADWSTLPISGLFVDMLRRLVELSQGTSVTGADTALPPYRVLNGFGELQTPNTATESLPTKTDDLTPSPRHPPGLYGTASSSVAFNLGAALSPPAPLPTSISTSPYQATGNEHDLQPLLLLMVFILLLGDFLLSLHLRGLLSLRKSTNTPLHALGKTALILFCLSVTCTSSLAATPKEASEFSSRTTLAYVITGNRTLDQISASGLTGLAAQLHRRTAINQPAVTGIDLARDELSFFPLLYWPLDSSTQKLSDAAAKNVTRYLQHGGMILFDTREGATAGTLDLRRLLDGLTLPPLIQLPQQHVLKRSFYLLDDVPGRTTGGTLWIEPAQSSAFDGVATILIGSHDWASAWAVGKDGRPEFPCTPGGETQREYAYRFGVNLVMYALTGNYKEDQLHAKALLERGVQ